MNGIATTVVDVFRDVDASASPDTGDVDFDGWGNEIETPRQTDADPDDDPYLEGVPMSLIERTQRAPDPSSGNLVAVRAIVGRVTRGTDIVPGDRIRDRLDGAWYAVSAFTEPQGLALQPDRRLELTRVG